MKKLVNLKDLLIEQIRELHIAEKQQHEALSMMQDKISSRKLKRAVRNHIDETEHHIRRLEDVLKQMVVSPINEKSPVMQAFVNESMQLIDRCSDPEITDAAIITAIQYMEHYEIAAYGSACTFAKELQLDDIAYEMHLNLHEEKDFDDTLSEIATEQVNQKAKAPVIV